MPPATSSAATASGARSPAFAIAAAGMALLARVASDGTYLHDVLPGMLVAGFGLGIAVVTVSISVMTGARKDESGDGLRPQLHRPRDRRHDRHRRLLGARRRSGRRVRRPAAADGIAHAFLIAAHLG